ncbi:MAG: spore coat protein [Bacillaceae bacterium]|nr:spore coat protein [Bacillaceae bacterium]
MSFQDQDIMEDLKQDETALVKTYASVLTGTNCPVLQEDLTQLFNNCLQNVSLVSQQMSDYNWITPQFAPESSVEQAVMTYKLKKNQLEQMAVVDIQSKKQPGVQAT